MKIYEYISKTDIPTFQRIVKYYGFNPSSPKKQKKTKKVNRSNNNIKLGDSAQNLMKHDSYKRCRGALKQTRWE